MQLPEVYLLYFPYLPCENFVSEELKEFICSLDYKAFPKSRQWEGWKAVSGTCRML